MAAEIAFQIHPGAFYATVWLAAYFAGYSRFLRAKHDINHWDCLRRSLFSGFLGFATVSVLLALWPNYSSDGWHLVGVSALVGLLGKEQEQILAHIANKVMDFMGVPKDANTKSRRDDRGISDLDRDRSADVAGDRGEAERRNGNQK